MFAVPPQLPVSPSPPSTQSRTKVIDDQVVGAATGGFRLWQATLFPAERGARTSVIYNCYLRNAGSPTERLSNNRIPCPTSMCSLGSTTGRIPGFLHDPTATAGRTHDQLHCGVRIRVPLPDCRGTGDRHHRRLIGRSPTHQQARQRQVAEFCVLNTQQPSDRLLIQSP